MLEPSLTCLSRVYLRVQGIWTMVGIALEGLARLPEKTALYCFGEVVSVPGIYAVDAGRFARLDDIWQFTG